MPSDSPRLNDDFRALIAAGDTHHWELEGTSDAWLDRYADELNPVYGEDGEPLVVLILKRMECPIEPRARMRIRFMPVHQERDVTDALAEQGIFALTKTQEMGSELVWGFVPQHDTIIIRFLTVLERGGVAYHVDKPMRESYPTFEVPRGRGAFWLAEPRLCLPFIQDFQRARRG